MVGVVGVVFVFAVVAELSVVVAVSLRCLLCLGCFVVGLCFVIRLELEPWKCGAIMNALTGIPKSHLTAADCLHRNGLRVVAVFGLLTNCKYSGTCFREC